MKNWSERIAITGGILAITGAAAVVLSGYGYQWGWWGLGFAFRYLLFGGSMAAGVGLIVSYVSFIPKGVLSGRPLVLALTGLALGGAALVNFGYWRLETQKYPPIHDITTDTENPPRFVAIAPLRADAPNPVEYAGEETAEIQREHYPEIEPLWLGIPYDEAFDRALKAAESMPWEPVDYSRADGRIEAFHKLGWYGFIDDVVIRVDSVGADSSRIDVRSKSRMGGGDVGVNAWRIRTYLETVRRE